MTRVRCCIAALFLAFPVLAQGQESGSSVDDRTPVPRLVGTLPLPPRPPDSFTIVVIPDSQAYLGAGCKLTPRSKEPVTNPNLEAQVDWIVRNRERENIVFVSHVGDIVDRNRAEQWQVAKQHLDRLRGVVPFSLTVGNHDMTGKGDAHLFQSTFPAASFQSYPWYLTWYEHQREDHWVSANNVNSAQIFSAGGLDFIHVSLECNAPDDVLNWADALLREHATRRALITTHMDAGIAEKPKSESGYIHDAKGRMDWVKCHGLRGNSGEEMWRKLYRRHSNLALILCGDQSRVTTLRVDAKADDGHTIVSLLTDYMSQPALRLLRFVPPENRVDVLTYEVSHGLLVEETTYVKDRSLHQFTFRYPMMP